MKRHFLWCLCILSICIAGCSKDNPEPAPDPELKGGDEPAENGISDDEAVDGRDNNEETESVAGTADPDTDSDEEL